MSWCSRGFRAGGGNTEWRLVMKSGSELMIVCSQCSVSAKDTLKRTAAILITRRLCSSVLYEHHVADIEYVCSLQISKVCLLFQWRWWRTYRRHTAVVFTLFHPPYCNQLPTCTTWQRASLPVLSRVRTSCTNTDEINSEYTRISIKHWAWISLNSFSFSSFLAYNVVLQWLVYN